MGFKTLMSKVKLVGNTTTDFTAEDSKEQFQNSNE